MVERNIKVNIGHSLERVVMELKKRIKRRVSQKASNINYAKKDNKNVSFSPSVKINKAANTSIPLKK